VAAKFELVAEALGRDEEEMEGDARAIALEEGALAGDVNLNLQEQSLCPS
jgi:hypothetical protein